MGTSSETGGLDDPYTEDIVGVQPATLLLGESMTDCRHCSGGAKTLYNLYVAVNGRLCPVVPVDDALLSRGC